MCVSCGCGEGSDDHGSVDNITTERLGELTEEELIRAAEAQGISVEEVKRNIQAARARA